MKTFFSNANVLRNTFAIFAAVFFAQQSIAQELATTEAGRRVRLNPNGTWENVSVQPMQPVTEGVRSVSATEKYALRVTGYNFFFDPTKWEKSTDEPGRAMFHHRGGDGYAMILVERISIPLDRLPEIALQLARKAAPDAAITGQEQRTVNGRKMLALRMKATVQGIPYSYLNQYYSGKAGTVQILTFTGEHLFGEYAQEFESFLTGLDVGD